MILSIYLIINITDMFVKFEHGNIIRIFSELRIC